jgi:hypothetical protein
MADGDVAFDGESRDRQYRRICWCLRCHPSKYAEHLSEKVVIPVNINIWKQYCQIKLFCACFPALSIHIIYTLSIAYNLHSCGCWYIFCHCYPQPLMNSFVGWRDYNYIV